MGNALLLVGWRAVNRDGTVWTWTPSTQRIPHSPDHADYPTNPTPRWSFCWPILNDPGPDLGQARGLLPCGLVYAALGWALTAPSTVDGAMRMLGFGVGTLPAALGTRLARTSLWIVEQKWTAGAPWRRCLVNDGGLVHRDGRVTALNLHLIGLNSWRGRPLKAGFHFLLGRAPCIAVWLIMQLTVH